MTFNPSQVMVNTTYGKSEDGELYVHRITIRHFSAFLIYYFDKAGNVKSKSVSKKVSGRGENLKMFDDIAKEVKNPLTISADHRLYFKLKYGVDLVIEDIGNIIGKTNGQT